MHSVPIVAFNTCAYNTARFLMYSSSALPRSSTIAWDTRFCTVSKSNAPNFADSETIYANVDSNVPAVICPATTVSAIIFSTVSSTMRAAFAVRLLVIKSSTVALEYASSSFLRATSGALFTFVTKELDNSFSSMRPYFE